MGLSVLCAVADLAKVHATKSHLQDRDGFAVVVSGVPCVSRSNVVTSYNSHSQLRSQQAFHKNLSSGD